MADEAKSQAAAAEAPPSNEALLAELRGGAAPAAAAAEPAKDDDDPDGEGDGDANEDEDGESGAAAPGDEASDDEGDEEPAEDPEEDADELAAKDPELAKRLRVIRQTEQRQRAALAADRAAFDRERSEWKSQSGQVTEAQKRFEALAARADLDPAGVLEALGVKDMEYAAQQTYARSKAAASKPEYRTAAERAMRDREQADKLTANERRIQELEKKITERDQASAAQVAADQYLGRIVRKADDTTPRVKALIAKNPGRARAELGATALELAEKAGGAMPKAAAVVAAHEKKIARQLRDYGVDSPTGTGEKPDIGDKPKAGGKPPVAAKPAGKKPAAAGGGASEQPSDPKAITIPTRDDLLRELQAERGSN